MARAQDRPAEVCEIRAAPIPPPPGSIPDALRDPVEYDVRHAMGADLDLGVGHVRPEAEVVDAPALAPEWIRRVEVPLYDAPGGGLRGWIANGWWIEADRSADPVALVTDAMVETGYEDASWIVEEADDGAVRIRFAESLPGGGEGAAWALLCHLAASPVPLAYEPWEEALGTLLFFRTDAAHVLRAGPDEGAERIDTLRSGEEPMLEPLEIEGDWMRVRVTRPSTYCAFPEPTDGRVDEGWIRWRDDAMGPWVWYFTRGC